MIRVRQQAGPFPQSLPFLLISTIALLLLCEPTNGQPNYYFKASAPAVKSLPRIGRRSDDTSGGGGDASFTPSISLARSLDLPGGMMEMWQNNGNSNGETSSSGYGMGSSNSMSSSSGSHIPSLIAPYSPSSNQMLDKSVLWRRLLGDLNNYEEALLQNMYRPKT